MSNADEIILRCRKCRYLLVTRKTRKDDDDACCQTFAQLEPILDDDYRDDSESPAWLLEALNENEWRKGKFFCPGCKGKVGSFNFITVQKCVCGRLQSPPVYFYKNRIDVCSTKNKINATRVRDHFAILKKSARDEEWTVVFDSKPSNQLSATPPPQSRPAAKTHRKSQSWHASGSTVSNWFTSALSDVSSQLDIAATETKQALIGTLDLASSAVAAPVSLAIKKGHRKTKSWSGSIKTTLSSLLGGLFSTGREPNGANIASFSPQRTIDDNSDGYLSNSGTPFPVESDEQSRRPVEAAETVENNVITIKVNKSNRPFRGKKRRITQTRQRLIQLSKLSQPRTRSASLDSIIPDYLLCAICLDIFCLPRYCLPCRHVFCEPCLKLLAHSLPLPRNRIRALCPLCRQIIRWTESATDVAANLIGSNLALRYVKRVLDYENQPSVHSLLLPGLYQLKFVRRLIGCLPNGVARYIETFWVDYTPLVTLYSFCVFLLCLLFFFTLFLPCVYLTSWLCKFFENFSAVNEVGAGLVYQEILDFGASVLSSGMLSLASIIVIVSIALYTLFVM